MSGDGQDRSGNVWIRALPFGLGFLIVALDRVTKLYIRSQLSELDSIQVIPGLFRIVHTENSGAAFGMLSQSNPVLRSIVLVGISGAVLIFVASSLLKRTVSASAPLSRLALAFILGGAIGNLYDRIFRGMVTDFIEIYSGTWSFPAFNVADSAITIGAALMLLELIFSKRSGVNHTDINQTRMNQTRMTERTVHPPSEP